MYALHEGFESLAGHNQPPEPLPMMGEAAAPDIPREVGVMILGAFGAIISAFLLLFTRGLDATMMVVISGLYFAIYLAVPTAFFNTEGRSGQLSLRTFLADGLETWTGHVDGRGALIQILSIPVTIAVAVTGIGTAARIML